MSYMSFNNAKISIVFNFKKKNINFMQFLQNACPAGAFHLDT